jgi:hypothetical protein
MRHTKKKLVNLSIYALFMTAMYGGYVGSLSWFDNKSTLPQDFKGESANAFFAGGKGTSSEPYKITTARHFYNLCWLQYLGRFNKDTDNDGVIDQVYFTLENDISFKDFGSALPPIGTTKYPFVGNFNGNDHVISDYTITDEYSKLTKHPSIIDTENTYHSDNSSTINYCSIIGTFGVIGYNTTGSIDVDSSETSLYDFSSSQLDVNSVSGLYIKNVTIKPKTKNTLAGLLAGYVSANISDCGVNYSNFDFSNGATNISSDKFNGKLSNYTLIGDYNSTQYAWDGHSSGQNNDFGGSIDMLTMNRRISYIKSSGNSGYNVTFGTTSSSGYNWLTNSTYTDLSSGSYLPINIDLTETSLVDVSGKDDTSNSYYSTHSSEPTLNTNSGYITGGNVRVRAQASNKDNQGIKYAVKRVSGTTTGSQSGNYDLFSDSSGKVISLDKLKSNIGFLTYSFDQSGIAAIYDDDDKDFVQSSDFVYKVAGQDQTSKKYVSASSFAKYSSVKNNLLQMFYDSTNAYYNNSGSTAYAIYLPGFRFQNWSTDSTFTATTKWLGEDKTVTFHNNGVQFELKKDGYITAIVSKYDSSGNFVFYNLYSVDMDNGATLTKINTIHRDSSGNITYNQSDSSTKVFDFSPLLTTETGMNAYQLFYFEIPVKKGAYFLSTYGSSATSSAYPYLLYLDIGANAGDSGGTSETVGTIKDVSFYYYDGSTLVKVTDGGTDVVFDISGDGSAIFYFNRIKDTGVLYFDENVTGLTRTLGSTVTGTSGLASDKTCTAKAS